VRLAHHTELDKMAVAGALFGSIAEIVTIWFFVGLESMTLVVLTKSQVRTTLKVQHIE